MFLQHLKLTKVRHRAVIGLVSLICILSSATATVSQTNLPMVIKIGVRLTVRPIGDYESEFQSYTGFCKVFSDELQKELKTINPSTKVELSTIGNGPNTGTDRYDSLTLPEKDYKKDMQCGPNSKQYDTDKIIFSDPFYTTQIKLILKKIDIDNLNKNFKDQSNKNIAMWIKKNIIIEAVEGTTTFDNLKSNQYRIISYKTRSQALEALTNKSSPIEALASDGIILRSLLSLLPSNEYDIFDKGLDDLSTNEEKYAIAISKMGNTSQYYQELRKATNKVLSQPRLQQESKKLKDFEDGKPTCALADTGGNNEWLLYVLATIFVLSVAILLLRFPDTIKKLRQVLPDAVATLKEFIKIIDDVLKSVRK